MLRRSLPDWASRLVCHPTCTGFSETFCNLRRFENSWEPLNLQNREAHPSFSTRVFATSMMP
jgi:hypothetical protein